VFAAVSKTADPTVNSATPGGFFFALSAYEAGSDIELLADEAGIVEIRRANVAWCMASACNALVVFEILNAGEWVFFVFIEF
jgi:hypothetical protein